MRNLISSDRPEALGPPGAEPSMVLRRVVKKAVFLTLCVATAAGLTWTVSCYSPHFGVVVGRNEKVFLTLLCILGLAVRFNQGFAPVTAPVTSFLAGAFAAAHTPGEWGMYSKGLGLLALCFAPLVAVMAAHASGLAARGQKLRVGVFATIGAALLPFLAVLFFPPLGRDLSLTDGSVAAVIAVSAMAVPVAILVHQFAAIPGRIKKGTPGCAEWYEALKLLIVPLCLLVALFYLEDSTPPAPYWGWQGY